MPAAGDGSAARGIVVLGVALDGAGIASRALALERAHDVTVRGVHVRRLRAGGGGAILVRSSADRETDTGEVTVSENVVELDEPTSGIVLRNVVNCLVSGNRVQGTGREGGHGIDLTLSRGCTVSDNVILRADVGVLADETNHVQLIGNYVYDARTGFRAGVRPDGRRQAANNVYVNNRVLTGGSGFVVGGSGMLLIGNYAAFLKPGPAIWVQGGGTHDALVGNNPSVAGAAGIRFDASDGVVVANVPISNDGPGIEVNGGRVAVSANATISNRIGIRLGERARACTVVGNTVEKAAEAPLVLGGAEHTVRDNTGTGGVLPERGRGATYGSGEADIRAARTAIAADFPDDRYLVTVEWAADPGGREWIAEKTRTGFVITLPGPPPAPVRVRWLARGL
jgi:nitrous oxidase accessory protein NosD